MDLLKYITVFLFFFLCFSAPIYSQSGSGKFCVDAEPLCGSTLFSYPNTSGKNPAELGPDYGCLASQLNPAWFYLQIANDGDLSFQIEQSTSPGGSPNLDVDFIIYGPFNAPVNACISDLTAANIVDCSYKLDFVEFANLSNTKTGEYYVLMITNVSKKPGYITVTQTAGSATTNCVLVETPKVVNWQACEGSTETLDATTAGAITYQWYEDDGSGNFNPIIGNTTAFLDVTNAGTYKAEAITASGVVIEIMEFHISFIETVDLSGPIDPYTICDYNNNNDGIAQFDLNTKTTALLAGYDASHYSVTYYSTETDAKSGTAAPLPLLYENTLQDEQLFVRIENTTVTSPACYTIGTFNIHVNLLPTVTLDSDYLLCVNTNGTEEIGPPTIDTGLSATDYDFTWSLDGTTLVGETNSALEPNTGGVYKVTVTDKITSCEQTAEAYVEESSPPIVSAEVVSYAFVEANNIEVTATGTGLQDYEYRLDNGPWQHDNLFRDVSLGEHSITVRNTSGCGQNSTVIMVMDYPHYFTPNGDTFNDTWSITGLKNQPLATINIYNRYGKLLKQLTATSDAWDGRFNGQLMATDDYWFTVEYIEPRDGTSKIFKSHFTLKR